MPDSTNKKVKVSKAQFAELLFHWLSGFLTEEAVKKTAKDIGFKVRSNKNFRRIYEELFLLNMWLTVYTCEIVIIDEDKRNGCLDKFHHLVYDRTIENKETNYIDFMMLISSRYTEYGKAREMEHPSTPLWVVANVFNKRLFGEIKNDLAFQTKVIVHQGLFVKHLGEAIAHYDIEW
ncbi:hypothetical protein ACFLU9_01005 [Chloroflexota bacterium]